MVKIQITENDAGQRLDRFLKKYLKRAPLSAIYKIIRKDLKVNGRRAKEDTLLAEGDELTFYLSQENLDEMTRPPKKQKARKQFRIAYEDDNIPIAEKPWGLLTHGDSSEKKNTLMNQVCGYLQERGEYDPASEKTFTPSPRSPPRSPPRRPRRSPRSRPSTWRSPPPMRSCSRSRACTPTWR